MRSRYGVAGIAINQSPYAPGTSANNRQFFHNPGIGKRREIGLSCSIEIRALAMTLKPFLLLLLSAAVCSAATLSIVDSEMREAKPGPMTLGVNIAATGGAPLDINRVQTRVCIFEKGPRGTVTLAKPDLSFRWLQLPVDWAKSATEKLEVGYPGPKPGYTYKGYGIAVYYDGVLQEALFSNKSLQKRFPFPDSLK
jgi:hypothetical protein